MTCPTCNADDWKLASVVYQEGLSHVATSSNGSTVGVGVGSGGVGVGYARTSSDTQGAHQTEFSKRAARPPYPQPPKPIAGEKLSEEQFEKGSVWGKRLEVILLIPLIFKMFGAWFGFGALLLMAIFNKPIKEFLTKPENYADYEKKWAADLESYEQSVKRFDKEMADYLAWDNKRICQRCGTGYFATK
jgi:hypothetical protein